MSLLRSPQRVFLSVHESVGFGTTRHQGLFYDLDTCQKIEEKLNKDKVVVSLTEHTNSSQYMQVILVRDNR